MRTPITDHSGVARLRPTGAGGRLRSSAGELGWYGRAADETHEGHFVCYYADGRLNPWMQGVIIPEPCEANNAPETMEDE